MKKIVLFVLMLFVASIEFMNAQDSYTSFTDPPYSEGASMDSIVAIKEVIVESDRVYSKKDVQHTAGSIGIITARDIESNNMVSLRDATSRTPNFFMPDNGSYQKSPLFIRGIGSSIGAPAVGLYVDDIPYFEKGTYSFDFFDINHIEILNGPQSSLYGRNTLGGLVYILTQDPTSTPQTQIEMNLGNYYKKQALISHARQFDNGQWGLSLAAYYNEDGGYWKNKFTDKDAGIIKTTGARMKLLYTPNTRFQAKIIVNGEKHHQDGYTYSSMSDSTDKYNNVDYNRPSSYERTLLSTGLVLKYSGDNYNIKSASSYQYYQDMDASDRDFSNNASEDTYWQMSNKQNLFTQELTLSTKKGRWESVTGLFGFHENNKGGVDLDINVTIPPYPGFPGGVMTIESLNAYDHTNYGGSVFHQSKFTFGKTSVAIGARLDNEKNTMGYNGTLAMNMPPTHLVQDSMYDASFNSFMPKLSVAHSFNQDQMIYGQITKGYRSGGINETSIGGTAPQTYQPDENWNYELGYKASWFNGKLISSLSVFYIDWKQQQIVQTFGDTHAITNVGKSTSYGFEASLTANPCNRLFLSTNWGYTHATYDQFIDVDSTSYENKFVPYVPLFTGNISADYSIPVTCSFAQDLFFHVDYNRVGRRFWDNGNKEEASSYGLLNANLGMWMTSNIKVTAWAKNILNTKYHAYYTDLAAPLASIAQSGAPFTAGLKLSITL